MTGRLVLDLLAGALLLAGTAFFLAGTVGLLRFPDLYTRLHALAKADALGLGLVVAGLCLRPGPWAERLQLVLIWLLVLASTATVAHLLARTALDRGLRPVTEGGGAGDRPSAVVGGRGAAPGAPGDGGPGPTNEDGTR